jgi:hypothetical protein
MSRPPVPTQVREALPRTSLGLQPFKDIAHSLRFAKWRPFDPSKGTLLDTAQGECFVGVEYTPDCPVSGIHAGRALVGRLSFLAPGAERAVSGQLSLRVIPWRGTGWALVTLADSTYVGAEWVAFVPAAEVVAAVQEAQQ